MRFFERFFESEFLRSGRFVFVGGTVEAPPPPGAGGGPEKGKEGAEKPPEPETEEDRLEALRKEQNALGEAKDYVETFKKSKKFEVLTANLELGMSIDNTQGFFNFENWLVHDPKDIADLFEKCTFIPSGKGKNAFVDGLKADPKENKTEFDKSRTALEQIVKALREHFELRRKAKADTQAQIEKHPMGDTIGNGVKTLMKNFNRVSGTEKLMIAAAVGIGIALINKYKDSKVPFTKDMKWSSVFLGLGALWGVNYLSGKVSQDGRTIMQRFDVGRDIDDMSDDNPLKGYAERLGMGENKEKLRTYYALQTVDVKRLFEAYREAALATTTKKEISAQDLGLKKDSIDGAHAYELMDTLVKATSVNEEIRRRREEAEQSGVTYTPPSKSDIAAWQQPGVAIAAFSMKYVTGPLGNTDQTYFDAVMNEYGVANAQEALRKGESADAFWRQEIQLGKDRRLTDRAAKKGKEAADWTYRHGKKYGIIAGKWVYRQGKKVYEFSRDHIAKPIGAWAVSRYNKYKPKIERPLKEKLAYVQEQEYLNKVLGPEFDVDVTSPETTSPGRATVMGYPGIVWEEFVDPTGKDIVRINSIDFDLNGGIAGNAPQASRLELAIQTNVEALIKSKNIPALGTIKPTWDKTEKKWFMKGVAVGGDPLLGLTGTTTDLSFKIEADGKTVKFFDGAKEIDNFAKIDTIHRDAEIEKAVWNAAPPALKQHIDGLSVTVDNVTADPTYGARIKGKLAGLEFEAVRKTLGGAQLPITNGIDFFDSATSTVGGFEKLKIDRTNGGLEFSQALAQKVLEDPYFTNPFNVLEAQMENTSEGVLARIKDAASTTRLWIIPTNISGALNGKILQRQWKYTLDFKMYETLDMFEHGLQGKKVNEIDQVYQKYIAFSHKELDKLSRYIASRNDDQKAKEFQDYLSGPGQPATATTPEIPAGLEYLNYPNPAYRKLFEKFQAMITNPRYNYAGLEGLDASVKIGDATWGVADQSYETYQTLLRVWSRNTRRYAEGVPGYPPNLLSPAADTWINEVITKVQQKLEVAMTKGGGTIKKENLPPSKTEADLRKWVA